EADLPPPPPVIDNTRQPQMSDMTACLNELSYIPLNNKQNEPTQRDIGKKVPKKVLRYFPIIPRLQRLYKSSHTANEMTWQATRKCTEPKPRNVRLGLVVDGFNPFGNLSQSYSMWLVILTTYNLPPWLCMKESYFMLTLLIPGPKSLGKDIDVYLRPLIDDLKVLWAKPGVETIDVATGIKFNMRAMVLWTINDFLARSSLSGWSGQGYKACPAYVMHIEKNVLESILYTLLMNYKSKDTTKARQDLERLGIRSGLWLSQNKNRKCSNPQATYSFIPEDRKKFCQFIKGVKLPDGFGSNFKHKVTDNDTNITGLKSHDCHIMMQRLLPYGLQQYLAPDVAKPLIELCLFFK
nr:hypothetical protein [Tanacetum cinerariifolium]